MDVLKKWDKVVELAKQSDFVFNMIDVGDCFDFAVQSLTLSLNIPLCIGGTFQSTATVDFINPTGSPCLSCINDREYDENIVKQLLPSVIQSIDNLEFIPRL